MRAHDADDVIKKRGGLVRAGRDELHEHLDQRPHHLLDLLGVILGDAGLAHGVKQDIRNDSHGAVLALHQRRDQARHVIPCVFRKALLDGLPLVGIGSDQRQDKLLNIVLRGIDLGTGGEHLGEELLDEFVEELALSHNITADAGDDLVGSRAGGNGDIFEVVDAVFAGVFKG